MAFFHSISRYQISEAFRSFCFSTSSIIMKESVIAFFLCDISFSVLDKHRAQEKHKDKIEFDMKLFLALLLKYLLNCFYFWLT